MKIYHYVLIIFLTIVSCRPSNALIPLKEVDNVLINEDGVVPINIKPHIIHTGDELTVKILSEDPNLGKYLGTEFVDNGQSTTTSNNTTGNAIFNGRVVDENGYINIPYLGKIYVLDKTFEEATQTIKQSLRKLYKGEINVKVDLMSYTYYQLGDSGHKAYNSAKRLNLLEYFAQNGGFTGTSKIDNITVLKKEENGYRPVEMNLKKMSIINQQEFYLDNGDVIIVDPVKTKNLGIGTGTGLQNVLMATSFITSMLAFYAIFKD